MVICKILEYKFDRIEFEKFTNNLSEQLIFDFEESNKKGIRIYN